MRVPERRFSSSSSEIALGRSSPGTRLEKFIPAAGKSRPASLPLPQPPSRTPRLRSHRAPRASAPAPAIGKALRTPARLRPARTPYKLPAYAAARESPPRARNRRLPSATAHTRCRTFCAECHRQTENQAPVDIVFVMPDWQALAKARKLDIPQDAIDRISPALDALDAEFARLLPKLSDTVEPAVTLSEAAVFGSP